MPSRSRGPGRLPRGLKRVKTPRQDVGTPEGMLFQVNAQLKAKRKYLEKIKGDIAYLLRRKRILYNLYFHLPQLFSLREYN